MGEYGQGKDRQESDEATREARQPNVPERSPRKGGRESDAQHRRNIVRCNRLLLLEAFVLASLAIALILSFVLK